MTSFDRLSQNINDKSQPVATRRAAVIEIAKIGGKEALSYILQALTDDAPGVRREAAIVLEKYSPSDVTTALLEAIKSEDNDLTLWTQIEVLGNIGSLAALPALQDLIGTTLSPLTRRVIEKSIDEITSRLPSNAHDEQQPSQEIDVEKPKVIDPSYPTDEESDQQTEEQQEQNENSVEVVDEQQHLTQKSDEIITYKIESNPDEDEQEFENADVPVSDLNVEQDQRTEMMLQEESEQEEIPEQEEIGESSDSDKATDEETLEDLTSSTRGMLMSGTSPALPVLVPNTSVVVYEQEEQQFQPGVFDLVLRPTAYLSKRWVSRARLYVVLLSLLAAATFALVYSQVQRQPRSPYRPNPAIAYMENPEKYFNAGIFFIQQEDYNSAIETLEFLRGVDSIDVELYSYLGYAYFQEHRYASATESFEYYFSSRKSNTYQPFVAEAAYQDKSDEKRISEDYMIYNLLGTAYKRLGNFHKAHQVFEEAIKLAPFEAEAYSNLAQLYTDGFQQKDRRSEALAYIAVNINPDMSSYHDTLGWIYAKNGRLHKGTNILKQAIRLQSDYIPAHYHLSRVAQKSKDSDSTINVVKKDLIDKLRPTSNSRSNMIKVLTYIYETKSQNMPKYNPTFLHDRILRK